MIHYQFSLSSKLPLYILKYVILNELKQFSGT